MRLLYILVLLMLSQTALAKPKTTHLYLAVPGNSEIRDEALQLHRILQGRRIDAIYAQELESSQRIAHFLTGHSGVKVARMPSRENWTKSVTGRHHGKQVLIIGESTFVSALMEDIFGEKHQAGVHHLYEIAVTPDETVWWEHNYQLLEPVKTLKFQGEIEENRDLSAICRVGDSLLTAADEGDSFQLLQSTAEGVYQAGQAVSLGTGGEMDIEALASDHRFVYVLGSHSRKRKKVSAYESKSRRRAYQKNRARLTHRGVEPEETRHHLVRMELSPEASLKPTTKNAVDLTSYLSSNPTLGPFVHLASKENGVDLEGVAVKHSKLYVGFRGPVLREGFVPVMELQFDQPEENRLSYVNLGGRGIRSLCEVSDGFLILAGPVGDAQQSFQLYHWDGRDCLPGKRTEIEEPCGVVRLLGAVSTPLGAKAEGLEVLDDDGEELTILVLFDGIENGCPSLYRVKR